MSAPRRPPLHTGAVTSPGRGRTLAERAALELQNPAKSDAERDARALRRKHDDDAGTVVEILNRLGHVGYRIDQTVSGLRWFAWCSCGFVTTTRNTETDAAGALIHHTRIVLRAWHRSGLPLADFPPAPPADWERVGRKHPHWARKMRQATREEIDERHLPQSVREAV
jgi:hypothetical protein